MRTVAQSFLQSYLFVWWFLLGLSLGSLALLMIHELTGGEWGELIRPTLEGAVAMLPLTLLLSLPLFFGLGDLYPWARPEDVSASALLQAKAWYLGTGFFMLRTALCFAVWLILARLVRDPQRRRNAAPAGLLAYAVTITVAAVDWIMSLMPEWYSTVFGLLVMVGQTLCGFAFAVMCTVRTHRRVRGDTPAVYQDLGNLLLMFVMVWTYLAYMQYIITWAGNGPDEIAWYLRRARTSWRGAALVLVVFHFALPFLVLLSRRAKRAPQVLGLLAATLVLSHLVDAFWLVVPTFRPSGFGLAWSDALVLLLPGTAWYVLFLRNARLRHG